VVSVERRPVVVNDRGSTVELWGCLTVVVVVVVTVVVVVVVVVV